MNKSTSSMFTQAKMNAIINKKRELEKLITEAEECLLADNDPCLGDDIRLLDFSVFSFELKCLAQTSECVYESTKQRLDQKIAHYSKELKKCAEGLNPISMYAESRIAFYKRCLERRPKDKNQSVSDAEQVAAEEQKTELKMTSSVQTEKSEDKDHSVSDAEKVAAEEQKTELKMTPSDQTEKPEDKDQSVSVVEKVVAEEQKTELKMTPSVQTEKPEDKNQSVSVVEKVAAEEQETELEKTLLDETEKPEDKDQSVSVVEKVAAEEQKNELEKTLLDQTEKPEDKDQSVSDTQRNANDAKEKTNECKKIPAEKTEETIQSAENCFFSTEESKHVLPKVSSQEEALKLTVKCDNRQTVEKQKEVQQVPKEEKEHEVAVKEPPSSSVKQTNGQKTSDSTNSPPNRASWAGIVGSAANKPAAYVSSTVKPKPTTANRNRVVRKQVKQSENKHEQTRSRVNRNENKKDKKSYPDHHKIFIGSLKCFITSEQIRDHFEQFGKVADVNLVDKKRTTNFGFVTFENAEAVLCVLDNLDKAKRIRNTEIVIDEPKPSKGRKNKNNTTQTGPR